MDPQQKTAAVKRHFDRVASRYDLMNTILSFGLHHLWKGTEVKLVFRDERIGEMTDVFCVPASELTRKQVASALPVPNHVGHVPAFAVSPLFM